MSKCVYCKDEIDVEWDVDWQPFGLDGDVIHKKCIKPMNVRITTYLDLTDEEFEKRMKGDDIYEL